MAEPQHQTGVKQDQSRRIEKAIEPSAPEQSSEQAAMPAVSRRGSNDPRTLGPQNLLALQHTIGNRAVGRLIQHKVAVGATHDAHEQEADRAAGPVMSVRVARADGQPYVQRIAEPETEVQIKRLVQRRSEEKEEGARGGEQAPQPGADLSLWERTKKEAFEAALGAAGVDPEQVMGLVGKAGGAVGEIFKHPGRFVNTLMMALSQGFTQFKDNISTHLQSGLMGWLFGTLTKAGIEVPKDFSLKSILTLVLQVLGVTVDALRQKVVKLIGEKNVARLEQAWDVLARLMDEGIGGLWEMLKEYLGDLKEMVIGEIKSWVITQVVQAAVLKVLAMFNPVSGLITIIKTIYNVVKFLMERAGQITALFQAIAGSVAELAIGNIGAAAGKVEQALARLVPVTIGLLASLLGLGGIADKIRDIIKRIQSKVEQAIDKAIGGIVKGLKKIGADKLFNKAKAGIGWAEAKVKKGTDFVKNRAAALFGGKNLQVPFKAGGESHKVWVETAAGEPKLMVASEIQEIDTFIAKEQADLDKLPDLPDNRKAKALQVLAQVKAKRAEWAETFEELRQKQTDKAKKELKTEVDSARRQLAGTANVISTLLNLAKPVPADFVPGKFEYESENGRTKRASGWLSPLKGQRGQEQAVSGPVNTAVKALSMQGFQIDAKFDAGHLIADRFGGNGVIENLVPMEARANKSFYSYFEGKVAEAVHQGNAVKIAVTAHYDDANPFSGLLEVPQGREKEFQNASAPVKHLFAGIPTVMHVKITRYDSPEKGTDLVDSPFAPRERLALTVAGVVAKQEQMMKEIEKERPGFHFEALRGIKH